MVQHKSSPTSPIKGIQISALQTPGIQQGKATCEDQNWPGTRRKEGLRLVKPAQEDIAEKVEIAESSAATQAVTTPLGTGSGHLLPTHVVLGSDGKCVDMHPSPAGQWQQQQVL